MEVYTLDSLLRRERVIDNFESLIWTERFQGSGEFKLSVKSTRESRALLKPGTRLAMNESYRVMTVETVEGGRSEDGQVTLDLSGPSIEEVLKDRVAKNSMAALDDSPNWLIEGTPGYIARKIFHDICVTGILSLKDVIPFVIESSMMPTSTIPESAEVLALPIPPTTVYDAIRSLCEVYGMGFRLLRNFDLSQLYWDVYSGSDRTTDQSDLVPVIFSEALDNLQNTKDFHTIEQTKNVAYVYSPSGFAEVYPVDVDPTIEGFERRVLLVQADDITFGTVDDVDIALQQRGQEELAKARAFRAFDGEINHRSQYRYQQDYFLGDMVEMRNADGDINKMRVTEQIFASDKQEGDRAYPTLVLTEFVNAGSWPTWGTTEWYDLDADPTTWSEQP